MDYEVSHIVTKIVQNVQKVHDFQNQKALKRPQKLLLNVLFTAWTPKGQSISKYPFGIFKSPLKPTFFFKGFVP
jgi:hypothetical protein